MRLSSFLSFFNSSKCSFKLNQHGYTIISLQVLFETHQEWMQKESDYQCLHTLLDAFSHLYKRVCLSVRPSVTRWLNFWEMGFLDKIQWFKPSTVSSHFFPSSWTLDQAACTNLWSPMRLDMLLESDTSMWGMWRRIRRRIRIHESFDWSDVSILNIIPHTIFQTNKQ